MGCWNATCGLTSLPIISGEEVYVFPIVESYRADFCYSTALYNPVIIPFRAKYNDYGGGEECSGVALDLIVEGIRKNLIELEVGENQYHDIAVKREGFDVDTFFEVVHEKRLRVLNPLRAYPDQPKHKEVFFTMIRKDVVDRLWNEWTFDMWKGKDITVPEGFKTDDYYFKNVTYAKLAELIPDYMEFCDAKESPSSDAVNKIIKDDDADALNKRLLLRGIFKRQYFFEGSRDHMLSDIFGHAFGTGYAGGGFAHIVNFSNPILDKYFSGDKEGAYELMREALLGKMVNSFMEATRKVWLPVMHQGSQSEEYDEYRLLNKISTDVMNAREKEYEDDE
jgi:hypothetical protein